MSLLRLEKDCDIVASLRQIAKVNMDVVGSCDVFVVYWRCVVLEAFQRQLLERQLGHDHIRR